MDGAEAYYQKMVKNNDWEERSLIWLRSYIETDVDIGGILMTRKMTLRKNLSFEFDDLSPSLRKNNEIKLANMVYELSGDFVKKVDCDTLQNTEIKDRVVYFGPEEYLNENGRAYNFFEAAY